MDRGIDIDIEKEVARILSSFISWVGGKKLLRQELYPLFPKKYNRYVEVFGGGGWVLFGKPRDHCNLEVYNDYNNDLANLFLCARDKPISLVKELGFLPLNSRSEFFLLRQFLARKEFDDQLLVEELALLERELPAPDAEELKALLLEQAEAWDVRRAAAFYRLIRYSYGSGCTSFGAQGMDIRKTFGAIWEASRRLANTVVENKDFEALIRQYDRTDTFFYCDPPYYETEDHYEVVFAKTDHERLRAVLGAAEGKWMVSYNDCAYIRQLYDGCWIKAVSRMNNMAQRYETGALYPEVVITNYDPDTEGRGRKAEQMDLFLKSEEEYDA